MRLICCIIILLGCFSCQEKKRENEFPYKMGKLCVSKEEVKLGEIPWGKECSDTIIVYNPTGETVSLESHGRPAGIVCRRLRGSVTDWQLGGVSIPAGGLDTLVLGVKTEREEQLGYFYSFVRFMENGEAHSSQGIAVEAKVVEDFESWSEEERKTAPRIEVDSMEINFGELTEGEKAVAVFKLKNTGGRDLLLRKVETACGCTQATPGSRNIAPGESADLNVEFNSKGRVGTQRKVITVFCNDPERSQFKLVLKGYVKGK